MSQPPGAPPTSELAYTAGTASALDVERCPACDAPRPGRFCADCGERRIEAEDFSLVHFVRSAAEHVSNLDGTVPHTLARIWSPGFLAREYFAGRRNAYLRPIQLFLLVSLVLFFVLPKTGLLQWGLAQYRETGMFADLAVRLSDAAIAESGLSRGEYTRRFDAALWNQKRTAPLLLIPVFALATMLLEWVRGRRRERRYYVEHLVHSIHFFAYWLCVLFALFAFFSIAAQIVAPWAPARRVLRALGREEGLTLIITFALAVWLFGSYRRFFGQRRALAAFSASVSLMLFWWLFFSWYQTASVLGTLVAWRP